MDGHPEALIDLSAIKSNVSALVKHVGSAQLMAVVKSDGYGHGMVQSATAALAGGAHWLGVAQIGAGVALRQAGFTVPVLCLLGAHNAQHEQAISHDVDLSAGSAALVRQIAAAAQRAGRPARLHLKADTGMSRGGATAAEWPAVVAAAPAAGASGLARLVGTWAHFARADMPCHPAIARARLTLPDTWFDMVRRGGAVVGLSTLPGGAPDWLRPAMTLRARLVQVKQVPAGTGVSYGHRYTTSRQSTLGLIPLGYNEGIPRHASNTAQVFIRGRRVTISGTVCMNQIVVDFGDEPAQPGDQA